MDEEQAFSRLYARLLMYLDPDPVRSEQTLRAIQRAISQADDFPEKIDPSGSNPGLFVL